MNNSGLLMAAIACAIAAAGLLVAAIIMFFTFDIPRLIREGNGSLEQRQIEELRSKSAEAAHQRGKVNVFEELEKKAKVRRTSTGSLNIVRTGNVVSGTSALQPQSEGTTFLKRSSKQPPAGFVLEKNIIFTCTDEVI